MAILCHATYAKERHDTMKPRTMYLAAALALTACQPDSDKKEGSLAQTHPKLEKQLAQDAVSEPITEGRNPEIYQRYRITLEEYENSGNYAVGEMYSGRLAPLDANSAPEAKTYQTALREGLKKGVNFAGKYTVVTVGCGTACQMHYVVDRETGKVLDGLQSNTGATYSAGSSLFVVNPPDTAIDYEECRYCTPEAYKFENGKFVKISTLKYD